MELRILSAEAVKKALPMAAAIAGMKAAYKQLSTGQAVVPLRGHLTVAPHKGTTLVMPAYLAESDDLAVKVVSVFPENRAAGAPAIYGMVMVLEAETGRPLALMEGGTLTAIRTGAGAGAATDLLARPKAAVVAILGSGVQARTQLEAVCTVRSITDVRVYSPTADHVRRFVAEMAGQGPIPQRIQAAPDAATAVREADIICAATTATEPVFAFADLKPGVHINGVGSFLPTMQEIDAQTVQQAYVVVDAREAALAEAGDLIIPIKEGLFTADHIQAEIGEIVAGHKAGRTTAEQITFFKSVGNAAQDAVAGRIALHHAEAEQIGTAVTL